MKPRLKSFAASALLCTLIFCFKTAAFAKEPIKQKAILCFSMGKIYLTQSINGAESHTLQKGEILPDNYASLCTDSDSQAFFEMNNGLELRLKEKTKIDILNKNKYLLQTGTAGFKLKAPKDKRYVKTAFLSAILARGIFVVKTNPCLTRLCVVKGSASIRLNGSKKLVEINAGQEIAAAPNQLSVPYKYTDDLRYAWYWAAPEKEPSCLQ